LFVLQVKAIAPEIPTLFISADPDGGKILAMAYCPKAAVEKGLKVSSSTRPGPLKHVRAHEPKIGRRRGPAIV
jgi:hypothetical protein